MRALFLGLGALLASGCVVATTGAPCASDDNCPNGQFCSAALTCQEGGPDAGSLSPDGGASLADAGGALDGGGCVSDPGCKSAGDLACDPAGSNQLGTCNDVGGGCLKVGALKACPSPNEQVCNAGDSACTCKSGCAAGQTQCSASGTLQTCSVDANGACGTFKDAPACASGLSCQVVSGTAQCACAPTTDATLYVDPTSSKPGLVPNGAQTPSGCRFAHLGDALAASAGHTTVATIGASSVYPSWLPLTSYKTGDKITPPQLNGYYYVASASGTSGAAEPAWTTTAPATVPDNGALAWSLTATQTETHVTFDQETFPLDVPASLTVTSNECLQKSNGCDGRAYVVSFNDGTASEGIELHKGATLQGVGVAAAGSASDAPLVQCKDGTATVQFALLQAGAPGTAADTGFSVANGCAALLDRSVVRGLGAAGLSIHTDPGTATSTVSGAFFYQNLAGISVSAGSVSVGKSATGGASTFLNNGNAALVDGSSAPASADLTAVTALANHADGVVARGASATLTVADSTLSSVTKASAGVAVSSGAQATISASKLNGSSGDGLSVQGTGTKATVSATAISDNAGNGVTCSGGATVLLHGATLDGDSSALSLTDGNVTLDQASTVTNSLGNALLVHGGTLTVGATGDVVALQSIGGDTFLVTGGTLNLTAATLQTSGGVGVHLSSSDGPITAVIASATISGQAGNGLLAEKDSHHNPITLSMTDTTVSKNGDSGVLLKSDVALPLFKRNVLSGNPRAQLEISFPAGSTATQLSVDAGSCADANHLTCYKTLSASNAKGLIAGGAVNYSLDAMNIHWDAAIVPATPGDYQASANVTLQVPTKLGDGCGASTVSCN